MKEVNAHICPTCGGNLSVDIERQVYVCPYCGVTFDYDYFREESVLGIAARALKNNEFDSADRAYDFMLEKEPDNFEALRGKTLIAMNITKIEDIGDIDLYSKLNYEPVNKELDRAVRSSKPQDREYFTAMKDIVDAGHEYIDEKAQLEIQRKERRKTQERIHEFAEERDAICFYSPSSRFNPKKAVILTVICYLIICLLIFLGYKYVTRNPYAQAEDLSKYETTQTSNKQYGINYSNNSTFNFNDFSDWYNNNSKYKEALEREEQRKINYENWEKKHPQSYTNLIWSLAIASVIFAVIVFMLYRHGKSMDAEISRIKSIADEQSDKIEEREQKIAELKDRIKQDYMRLLELHPVEE